jgi:hypothetical protein
MYASFGLMQKKMNAKVSGAGFPAAKASGNPKEIQENSGK